MQQLSGMGRGWGGDGGGTTSLVGESGPLIPSLDLPPLVHWCEGMVTHRGESSSPVIP